MEIMTTFVALKHCVCNKTKEETKMTNEMSEMKVDIGLIANYGSADYIDGDLVVLDGLGNRQQIDGTFKFEMIMMVYCTKGRLQCECNGKVHNAKAGDVVICVPNVVWENVMVSPDFDSKVVGVSYKASMQNIQMNHDFLELFKYIIINPVIHLDIERQDTFLKYYSIIRHKIQHPHGYFHKEIMHSLLQSTIYELFAIITPYVEYTDGGGSLKQGTLVFRRFMELLVANNGKMKSVKTYAEELCITPKYLSSICKSVSGRTALEWIHDYTVKAIEQYLRRSNLSIKEISERLEFPNLSFFGKFTKNHLGQSPTQYRKGLSMKK